MRFPSRENDIAVLAEDLIAGLSEHSEFSPSPPVATEVLQGSYQAYREARDAAVRAEGTSRDAFDVKDDALDELTEHMKANLRRRLHRVGCSGTPACSPPSTSGAASIPRSSPPPTR